MIKTKLRPLSGSTIQLVDGDRGVNYPNKKDFSDNGFCVFLDSSNLTKNGFDFSSKVFISKNKDVAMGNGKLKRGDLVMNTRGTIGNMGVYKENVPYENIRINSGMLIIRGGSDYDNGFLYGFFRSNLFYKQVENIMSGSVQSQLPIWIFNFIQVPELSIPAQQKISTVLSALDSKIELNNRINAELEQMAKTLYDYWFVQFDFPNQNGKPYKKNGGKMVWNKELKRDIPEGWENGSFLKNSLTKILKPGINKFEGVKKYLATADINDREVGLGEDITYQNRESRANMQPIENSIWFAKMKASKKHLFIGKCSPDFVNSHILSTGFMGLKCKDLAFEYVASSIASDGFEIVKDRISHGATMQGIGNDDLKFIQMIVPDDNTLSKYKNLTSSMYSKMESNRQENKKLAELRDWLLPMLMNGQVTVNTISK